MASAAPTITLDPVESKLVTLLDACCDWLNAEQPQPDPEKGGSHVDYTNTTTPLVEVRVAGGWVRDKLLGKPSQDMDISVSVMTGLNFAILFQEYLQKSQPSQAEASSTAGTDSVTQDVTSAMSRIAKISANPEQSKALETATANILGLSLDFVNLRKEIYEGDSRIPTMTFGTPKEDAERRDICFNSLLYNCKTRQVEDWTGRGLDDLRQGIVRTPLAPLTTFLDDPLRVLRCLRFASRFDYVLHPDIVACLTGVEAVAATDLDAPSSSSSSSASTAYAQDPRTRDLPVNEILPRGREMIREALAKKVSRERVGTEVEKMMGGPYPVLAHALLHQLDLYSLVFHPDSLGTSAQGQALSSSSTQEPLSRIPSAAEAGATALQASLVIDALSTSPITPSLSLPIVPAGTPLAGALDQLATLRETLPPCLRASLDNRGEARKLLQFACALYAFRDVDVEVKKGKRAWIGEGVMMNSLKLSRNLTTGIHSLTKSMLYFQHSSTGALDITTRRHFVQNLPTDLDVSPWVIWTLLLRDKVVQNAQLGVTWEVSLVAAMLHDLMQPSADASRIVTAYSEETKHIERLGLAALSQAPPLLDGKEILAVLEMKPGRQLQPIQTALLVWQFAMDLQEREAGSQDASGFGDAQKKKEMAAEYLRSTWNAGGIVPFDERAALMGKEGGGKKGAKGQQQGATSKKT